MIGILRGGKGGGVDGSGGDSRLTPSRSATGDGGSLRPSKGALEGRRRCTHKPHELSQEIS